jgi:hypothetical protein
LLPRAREAAISYDLPDSVRTALYTIYVCIQCYAYAWRSPICTRTKSATELDALILARSGFSSFCFGSTIIQKSCQLKILLPCSTYDTGRSLPCYNHSPCSALLEIARGCFTLLCVCPTLLRKNLRIPEHLPEPVFGLLLTRCFFSCGIIEARFEIWFGSSIR